MRAISTERMAQFLARYKPCALMIARPPTVNAATSMSETRWLRPEEGHARSVHAHAAAIAIVLAPTSAS